MPEKILIVDDEEDVLTSTQMLLSTLGYEPIALKDPGRVLEVAEKEQPGLILQDLKMKSLNVAGLVASLRSNPATAEIPIVFFSASPDIANTAAKFDAWGYLPKPFTQRELAEVLDRTLHHEAGAPKRSGLEKDVKGVFHDYWNLLSALNAYVEVLEGDTNLSPEERKIVHGLDEVVLKLESKTDRLRSYLSSLMEMRGASPRGVSAESEGAGEPGPRGRNERA